MAGEIKTDDITLDNYKEFEAQLRRDLPLGISTDEVKRYLDEREIDYGDYSFEPPPYGRLIYVLIPNIYRELLLFTTDLWIKFRLDASGAKLIEIDVSLPITGP